MKRLAVWFLLMICSVQLTFASAVPDKPSKETSLYDKAQLMSQAEQHALEQKLIRYSDSTSTQIVIVTLETIGGDEIANYGVNLAQKWGIGQKGKDNGVLILVAKNERKVTIQTGYGVEHLLTDALCSRIIRNDITPNFKAGNFYGGLNQATDQIFLILTGEYQAEPQNKKDSRAKNTALVFVVVFLVLLYIISKKNNGKGGGRGGRRSHNPLLDAMILGSMGRSAYGRSGGFGGGSFGSGGFGGGFGGGGFGGGGASGGW